MYQGKRGFCEWRALLPECRTLSMHVDCSQPALRGGVRLWQHTRPGACRLKMTEVSLPSQFDPAARGQGFRAQKQGPHDSILLTDRFGHCRPLVWDAGAAVRPHPQAWRCSGAPGAPPGQAEDESSTSSLTACPCVAFPPGGDRGQEEVKGTVAACSPFEGLGFLTQVRGPDDLGSSAGPQYRSRMALSHSVTGSLWLPPHPSVSCPPPPAPLTGSPSPLPVCVTCHLLLVPTSCFQKSEPLLQWH